MTSIDVNLTSKMIENAKNRQFLSCKWPQYHFSMVFIMVYINSCSLLVCQMNIYWDNTHIDINQPQFDVENDRKCAKLSIFIFFAYNKKIVNIIFNLTLIHINFRLNWLKMYKSHGHHHNTTFWWFS